MEYLFSPRAVAVIGASTNPAKVGYNIVANLRAAAYPGVIYPINPKSDEVQGIRAYPSVTAVEGNIDLALVSIPAHLTLKAVEECGKKGVKHLVVITSGFSEVGNIEEEQKIVEVARSYGMRILGPNVFGIYSASKSMDATFGPGGILPGNVAIVTQSGALGIAMIGKTAVESLGLSALVSVGNKSDIDEADLLEYLVEDPLTHVIMLYMEGVKNGARLVETLKRVTRRKHVVVIKSGRSKRGAMAAASHTGSLAGADGVFDDVMRQCGVLRAESVQEAFNWVRFLASAPLPDGEASVIVTNGGGIGVLATDASEKYGVELYNDQQVLKKTFSEVMPDFGSSKNPVDLTGQASADDYAKSLAAVLEQPDMHSAIALYCETGMFDTDQFAKILRDSHASFSKSKPIVFSLFGGGRVEAVIRELRREGIPIFGDVYEAVASLGALQQSWRHLSSSEEQIEAPDIDVPAVRRILSKAAAEDRGFLLAHEAAELAEVLGLPMPRSSVARNLDEAVEMAQDIGYPVVMKVVSKDIVHKSDAGGVALDLVNDKELIDAYQAIVRSCRAYKPNAVIEGVEIAEMVRPGVETIVGARQDPSFGPTVMFGLGGIYVEVMKDVVFRAAPIGLQTAYEMIADVRSYPLLLGVRGEARKDIDTVATMITKLSHLISLCPEITDIEINPLAVYDHGDGAKAVDVRVLFTGSKEVE